MSSILLPSTRIGQPAGFVPLADKYKSGCAVVPSWALDKSAPVSVGQYGVGLAFDNNTSGTLHAFDTSYAPPSSAGVTAILVGTGGGTSYLYRGLLGDAVDIRGNEIAINGTTQSGVWGLLFPTTPTVRALSFSAATGLVVYETGVKKNPSLIQSFSGALSKINGVYLGNTSTLNRQWYGSLFLGAVFPFASPEEEIESLSDNPWQILEPVSRRIYFDMGAAAGGGVSGTAAFTESNDTAAATGMLTHRATASFTEANDTAAASGRLIHYGSAAFTESNDTAAASGSVGTTGVYGDVAFTESDDTLAALGRIVHRGTATITEADDTFAAAGRLIHRGTVAFVEDDDILEASDADPLYGFTQDQLDFLVSYLEANMAIPTVEQIAAAVLAASVETGATVAESLRLSNAVLGGKVSGAGTGTETFRDLADTTDRVVVTVDSSGNRTALTRDLT